MYVIKHRRKVHHLNPLGFMDHIELTPDSEWVRRRTRRDNDYPPFSLPFAEKPFRRRQKEGTLDGWP